jgi:hypothetical protein
VGNARIEVEASKPSPKPNSKPTLGEECPSTRSLPSFIACPMEDEPPRIASLRTSMVKEIPSRPGHREDVRRELRQPPLIKLLHAYLKWSYRLVPPRPSKVGFAPRFWESAVARSHGGDILALTSSIERGDDLSTYLSSLVRERGYVHRRVWEQLPREAARWRDRDFVLNVLGLHHLHISNASGPKGSDKRHGAELAFVEFDRDVAIFVYAGTHAEFRDPDLTARLSEEVAQIRSSRVLKKSFVLGTSQNKAESKVAQS